VIAIDPADDEMGDHPVDGQAIYFDNFYVQFNTAVDPASLCDEGAGMDECEFAIGPEDTGHCSTGGEYCIVNGPACPTADPDGQDVHVRVQAGREAEGSLRRRDDARRAVARQPDAGPLQDQQVRGEDGYEHRLG
jgi:hypothetical protein